MTHQIALLDADAVFAGETAAASTQSLRISMPAASARAATSSEIIGVEKDERVHVAVTGVKNYWRRAGRGAR